MTNNNTQSIFKNSKPYNYNKDYDVYYFNTTNQKQLTESFIVKAQESTKINEREIQNHSNFNWFSISLFVILSFIALGQILYGQHQKKLFKSFLKISEFQNYINQISIIRNPYFIGSMLIALVNFSLMTVFFSYTNIYEIVNYGLNTFVISLLIIGAWVVLKYIFIFIAGFVYDDKYLGRWYISHEIISLSSIGIIIFPLIWINFIEINTLYLTISLYIIAALLLIKIINMGIILYKNSNFYLFQIILYLCTLEILPVLILVKTVNQQFTASLINF